MKSHCLNWRWFERTDRCIKSYLINKFGFLFFCLFVSNFWTKRAAESNRLLGPAGQLRDVLELEKLLANCNLQLQQL